MSIKSDTYGQVVAGLRMTADAVAILQGEPEGEKRDKALTSIMADLSEACQASVAIVMQSLTLDRIRSGIAQEPLASTVERISREVCDCPTCRRKLAVADAPPVSQRN